MRRYFLFAAAVFAAAIAASEPPDGALVGTVAFQGNRAFKDEVLARESGLAPGQLYSDQSAAVGARVTASYYQRNGYLEAQTRVSTAAAPGAINVMIFVEEGPLYRFGETRLEGFDKLPEAVAQREAAFKKGDPYVRSRLFDAQTNLYSTGLFETVEVSASTGAAKTADVVVRVKERQLKWIKGGVGWGSEERERVTLILLHENLLRRAYRAELSGTWSSISKENRLDFVNPFLFGTRTEQRTSVSWRKENREGYDYERSRGEVGFGRDLTPVLAGSLALRLDRNIVYNESPLVAAFTPERIDARSVAARLNRDTSDDFFFPTRGTRAQFGLERFGRLLGGIVKQNRPLDMHRVTFDGTVYHPAAKWLVIAAALRSGWSEEYGVSDEVPVFERFFLGGANSVRGYDERSVGPADAAGNPLGGTRRLGSSLEARFPLFWKFRGALFVDGGQVAANWRGVDVNNWKWSAGGGLRLLTPVGPFRLDAGYKLNRDPADAETWRLHFSLGEAF